jgi:septum formation protein
MSRTEIILASASPRRSELLRQIGVAHAIRPVDIDETPRAGEAPAEYVLRLAREKGQTLWNGLAPSERRPVLSADTTVAFDGIIMGKPSGPEQARSMLQRLSGNTHEVHTAVALLHAGGADARVSTSEVSFRTLTPAQIDWYWQTGEPADKAGGYAVQGLGAVFIRHIAGSYSGIMGLPLFETWELLVPVLGLNRGSTS